MVGVGWATIVCAFALMVLFGYFLVTVVPPMTRPTPYFDKITEQIGTEKQNATDVISKDLVVVLEYANADIRAFNVQIAFALIGGFFLVIVGILLFTMDIRDAVTAQVSGASGKLTLSATAPGSVALILGSMLMLIGILKPSDRKLDALVERFGKNQISEQEVPVNVLQGEQGNEVSPEPNETNHDDAGSNESTDPEV